MLTYSTSCWLYGTRLPVWYFSFLLPRPGQESCVELLVGAQEHGLPILTVSAALPPLTALPIRRVRRRLPPPEIYPNVPQTSPAKFR